MKRPKVFVNLTTWRDFRCGMGLYNPSSFKGQCVKILTLILFPLWVVFSRRFSRGRALEVLEGSCVTRFRSSVYCSTDGVKYVVHLWDIVNKTSIVAKVSFEDLGRKRLKAELEGINAFGNLGLTTVSVLNSHFSEELSFLMFHHIGAMFNVYSDEFVSKLSKKTKLGKKLPANRHPRVLDIISKLELCGQSEAGDALRKFANTMHKEFAVSVEHGDLAPWNLYRLKEGGVFAFDFELFVKDGMEYLDCMKYYYTQLKLLQRVGVNEINDSLIEVMKGKGIIVCQFSLLVFYASEWVLKLIEGSESEFEKALFLRALES